MRTSETTTELFAALSKAAPDLINPRASETAKVKSKKTGVEFSYNYPAFDQIVYDARAVLSVHGLAAVQEATTPQIGLVGVTTRIVHSSGEWIEMGPLALPAGEGPQDYGSALTYARRYSLTAALLIAAEEDDDGAKAQSAKRVAPARSRESAPPTAEREPPSPPAGATQQSGEGSKPRLVHGEGASQAGPSSDATVGGERQQTDSAEGVELSPVVKTLPLSLPAPSCPKCGGLMLSGEMHHENGPSNRWICSDCNSAIKKEA